MEMFTRVFAEKLPPGSMLGAGAPARKSFR
jgi:hypothetical protein